MSDTNPFDHFIEAERRAGHRRKLPNWSTGGNLSRPQEQTLAAIGRTGAATVVQIVAEMTGTEASVIRMAISDLRARGLVKSTRTIKTENGRNAKIWELAE